MLQPALQYKCATQPLPMAAPLPGTASKLLAQKHNALYLYPINYTLMDRQFEDFDANLAGEEGKTEETKTSWFKRIKKGINTKTSEKKETPEGIWVKCPECNYICTVSELR